MCDLETRISGCALETWIPVWYLETRIFVWGLETRIPVCGLETGNSVGYLETKNFQVFQPSKFFLRNNGLLCANEHRSRFVSFYHFFVVSGLFALRPRNYIERFLEKSFYQVNVFFHLETWQTNRLIRFYGTLPGNIPTATAPRWLQPARGRASSAT